MNELIRFLYSLDLGWLGMVMLVIVTVILLVASFYVVAQHAMKSEEDHINDWRKLGEEQ